MPNYHSLIVATLCALTSGDDQLIKVAHEALAELDDEEIAEFFYSMCGLTMGLAQTLCKLTDITIDQWLQRIALG